MRSFFYFVTLILDSEFIMSVLAELPHSVLFAQPPNPETGSISRTVDGYKVIEPFAHARRADKTQKRAFHIQDTMGRIPGRHLLFTPTDKVDTISCV